MTATASCPLGVQWPVGWGSWSLSMWASPQALWLSSCHVAGFQDQATQENQAETISTFII